MFISNFIVDIRLRQLFVWAQLLVFFMGLFYILHLIVTLFITNKVMTYYRKIYETPSDEVQTMSSFSKLNVRYIDLLHGRWRDHIQQFNPNYPALLDFFTYLKSAQKGHIIELIQLRWPAWVFVILMDGLNALRAGFGRLGDENSIWITVTINGCILFVLSLMLCYKIYSGYTQLLDVVQFARSRNPNSPTHGIIKARNILDGYLITKFPRINISIVQVIFLGNVYQFGITALLMAKMNGSFAILMIPCIFVIIVIPIYVTFFSKASSLEEKIKPDLLINQYQAICQALSLQPLPCLGPLELCPDVEIDIEVHPMCYRLCGPPSLVSYFQECCLTGDLSPLYPITIYDADARYMAEIPINAKWYCFLYPLPVPGELYKQLLELTLGTPALRVLLVGGFIYFDDNKHRLQVNALCDVKPHQDNYEVVKYLKFSEPIVLDVRTGELIRKAYQFKPVSVPFLRDIGIKAFVWVPPDCTTVSIPNGGFAYSCNLNERNAVFPIEPGNPYSPHRRRVPGTISALIDDNNNNDDDMDNSTIPNTPDNSEREIVGLVDAHNLLLIVHFVNLYNKLDRSV
eukprot:NODE_1693_length_1845_cov_45.250290_g1436_i0.p1 GENE.NODE_1693_length_1845_cov_45.250290_g1436_i0~~NODE_1693_length_1845_cov_45.250290_g1436_i0.p1  ORF type:complete len:611 (-),score=67.60 NODE_1693_length_1845_cov_45.250290_g1436_i0:13-1728(-)